jgi:glycosyltransferase involved in cell wall biosynthesis
MDISLVICTYNRSGSLRRTLEHVRKMEVPEGISWELLVVDNNSKDDTAAVVESFRNAAGIRCRYLMEKNQGLSFARNLGIRHASGEIVVFTDDDVLVDRHWLKNIRDAFGRDDDVACVGGKILPFWEVPPPAWVKGELLNILALCDLGAEEKRLSEIRIWGANLSFRASILRKYGGFDTEFGHKGGKLYGGEETRYLQELINGGEKILYCPDVLVHHCIPEFRLRKRYFRKWYFDKGEFHALMLGKYEKRNIMGIPLITIKRIFLDAWNYVATCLSDPGNAMPCQMSLVYNVGIVRGRIKYRFDGAA